MKQASPLNPKTAFILAASISLLMNILFIIMFFYNKPPARDSEHFQHIFRLSVTVTRLLINFLAAFLLYLINFWLLRREWFARGKARVAVIVFACMIVISCAGSLGQMLVGDFGPPPGKMLLGGLFRDCFVAIIVILSSQLIYLSNKQQQTALENEILQGEYMKTRFMALKNQVDPHFLFNSLNTLSSLISTDAGKAVEYVQQLSRVFRHTLQNKEIITLEEELEFTLAYCHLMQIRHGDNLRFVRRVDERYYPCSIVPLSLQTLVENAIKHNVVSNRQPLTITFFTSDDATITVSNPVQPRQDAGDGEHVGLSNLSERYRLLWNKEIVIRDSGGVFDVEIPLIV
jgi:hypothetical protein